MWHAERYGHPWIQLVLGTTVVLCLQAMQAVCASVVIQHVLEEELANLLNLRQEFVTESADCV